MGSTVTPSYAKILSTIMSSSSVDNAGNRPLHAHDPRFRDDPHWQNYVLFYEYFHGDSGKGLGASHQTGWTGLIANLL